MWVSFPLGVYLNKEGVKERKCGQRELLKVEAESQAWNAFATQGALF